MVSSVGSWIKTSTHFLFARASAISFADSILLPLVLRSHVGRRVG